MTWRVLGCCSGNTWNFVLHEDVKVKNFVVLGTGVQMSIRFKFGYLFGFTGYFRGVKIWCHGSKREGHDEEIGSER